MHEQSLVRNLLKQVDEICRENDADHVTEVRVEIGSLSGVEPMLLANAFELLKHGTSADIARLVIDDIPMLVECKSCQMKFELEEFLFRCPDCDGNVKVISGDEFFLVSVAVVGKANEPLNQTNFLQSR